MKIPSRHGRRAVVFGLVLSVATTAFGAARYRVTNLEPLGFATATALNDRGQIAGTSAAGHLKFWDGTQTRDLGTTVTGFPQPTDLNNAGQIVGYTTAELTPLNRFGRAFVWADGHFATVGPAALAGSEASAINDAGVIVGAFNRSGVPVGGLFRDDHGTVTLFTDWPVTIAMGAATASAVNRSGEIAGTFSDSFMPFSERYVETGFRLSAGHYDLIGNFETLPATPRTGQQPSSRVQDLNDSGAIVGLATSIAGGALHETPFLYSAGRMIDLGAASDSMIFRSPTLRLNNLGIVAGGSTLMPSTLWSGGLRLNLSDLIEASPGPGAVQDVTALNDRGQILATAWVGDRFVPALLTPLPSTSRLVNLSARAIAGVNEQTCIAGFVLGGGGSREGSLLLRTSGPALRPMGVSAAADDPSFRLVDRTGATRQSNNDWGSASSAGELAATAQRLGAFPLVDASKDAALLAGLPANAYSVHAAAENPSRIVLTEIYDAGTAGDAPLVNASMRLQVGTGEAAGIVGFVIAGEGQRTLLIRAVGPSLAAQGVAGVLPNPQLWLYRGNQAVLGNDDWGSAATTPLLAETAKQVGAFALPDGGKDAALLIQVEPGVYSVHVTGVGDTTGVALVELYVVR